MCVFLIYQLLTDQWQIYRQPVQPNPLCIVSYFLWAIKHLYAKIQTQKTGLQAVKSQTFGLEETLGYPVFRVW